MRKKGKLLRGISNKNREKSSELPKNGKKKGLGRKENGKILKRGKKKRYIKPKQNRESEAGQLFETISWGAWGKGNTSKPTNRSTRFQTSGGTLNRRKLQPQSEHHRPLHK